jgi:hypothetical protein
MQAYKNNAYVRFEETIRMDRFLDRADTAKKARAKVIQSELNVCRERIQALTKGKVIMVFGVGSTHAEFTFAASCPWRGITIRRKLSEPGQRHRIRLGHSRISGSAQGRSHLRGGRASASANPSYRAQDQTGGRLGRLDRGRIRAHVCLYPPGHLADIWSLFLLCTGSPSSPGPLVQVQRCRGDAGTER